MIEDKPKEIYLRGCIRDNKYLSPREKEELLKFIDTELIPKERKDYVVLQRAKNKIKQMYIVGDLMRELRLI